MHTLERSQRIAAAPEAVFAFFSDPGNLARITPAWLRFRLYGSPPVPLGENCRIEYRIRWGLLTWRWVTRIARWNPPVDFEDAQESGPYAAWTHTHRFRPEQGGVVMEDHVEYALPFGPLGRVIHAVCVRRQLDGIFDFRRRAIDEIFPAR